MRLTWLLAVALPVLAQAGETHIIINGASHHINSTYDWNETHAGLGIEREISLHPKWSHRLSANAFRDSNDEMSYMLGTTLHRRLLVFPALNNLTLSGGLTAFMMSRSDANGGMPFPGILPSLTLGNKNYGINLTYMPIAAVESMTNTRAQDPTLEGIVFLQFRVGFGQVLGPLSER